jgi:hypothetical protein
MQRLALRSVQRVLASRGASAPLGSVGSTSTQLTSSTSAADSFFPAAAAVTHQQVASMASASFGRVTDEDRRWWLIHLECAPDVGPGTFCSWLDSCGTHTTKKLIERNVWTVEQVAALSSDQVDELRYKEGCIHMDIVWEHARTILVPLRARSAGGSAETSLQDRILELRKKRELERRRDEVLQTREDAVAARERTLQELRDSIAKKKELLRQRQQAAAAAAAAANGGEAGVESTIDRLANQPPEKK